MIYYLCAKTRLNLKYDRLSIRMFCLLGVDAACPNYIVIANNAIYALPFPFPLRHFYRSLDGGAVFLP